MQKHSPQPSTQTSDEKIEALKDVISSILYLIHDVAHDSEYIDSMGLERDLRNIRNALAAIK